MISNIVCAEVGESGETHDGKDQVTLVEMHWVERGLIIRISMEDKVKTSVE